MCERAPEKYALGHSLDIRCYRSTRSREARNGLEQSVNIVRYLARDNKRECTEERYHYPRSSNAHEALRRIHRYILRALCRKEQTENKQRRYRDPECCDNVLLSVDEPDNNGQEHKRTYYHEQLAHGIQNHFIIHQPSYAPLFKNVAQVVEALARCNNDHAVALHKTVIALRNDELISADYARYEYAAPEL